MDLVRRGYTQFGSQSHLNYRSLPRDFSLPVIVIYVNIDFLS
jgi:hypothetical protein